MSLLSRKQQVLVFIADMGPCTYEMIERELQMPRTTVADKALWLMADRAIDRSKVGRIWHFKATKLGRQVARVLREIGTMEANGG